MIKKDEIDNLLEFYFKETAEEVFLMRNEERYDVAVKAANRIAEMISSYDNNAEIKMYPDGLIGTYLCLSIVTDIFVIDAMPDFIDALKEANTIDVTPLVNGKIEIGLTFPDAWVPVPLVS